LIKRYRGPGEAKKALEAVWEYWNSTLGAVQVETPDLALNVLANGWLIYQVLSSRMWGRSGYYQSGGAFGFRDQLQDAMALIHVEPDLLRSQILLCAGRQFPEGDVQHWWHPPAGRGSRTRCSDDFLWLALASCRYIESTGDKEILGQIVPYIEGRPLGPEEESYYDLPEGSALKSNVYEHCVRAIKNGMRRGMHGLPLMGSGDWNDGMNMVGEKGEGESVWLAFFQYEVLTRFSDISLLNNDRDFSAYCLREAAKLITAIEQHAWDGAWYRRAYFDDGTPLGSAKNNECRIDSISQSWSVLSGAGSALRSSIGMDSMYRHLVSPKGGLIRLLEPPFDVGEPNPGYIQGYVPGVRENGGQYTHAAIWAIMAFAKLGNTERAWELFTMINPVNHSKSPEAVETYMVEPYVMPADIYSLEPHTGRGGWTWYTGSASWMYRLILESLLGLSLVSDKLHIEPKIPNAWNTYTIRYRYRQTLYIIRVRAIQAQEKSISLTLDGLLQTGDTITLVDDHAEHQADLLICRLPYSKEGGNTNC
jgi:cellobiose phosphorylase